MPIVLLAVYAVVGVVHEVAALRFWNVLRAVTKCLLMPALLAYYCVAAHGPLVVAILAIAFSWLGDVILLGKDNINLFRLGMLAFLLSHVFYIVTLVGLTTRWHVPALIASVVVALAAEIVLPRLVKPPKGMLIPILVYGAAICTMSIFALQYALSSQTLAAWGLFVGSIVFIFSDAILAYFSFGKKPKHFNAITMLPYIVAQALIVVGLACA